jgi:hypothetical protein
MWAYIKPEVIHKVQADRFHKINSFLVFFRPQYICDRRSQFFVMFGQSVVKNQQNVSKPTLWLEKLKDYVILMYYILILESILIAIIFWCRVDNPLSKDHENIY